MNREPRGHRSLKAMTARLWLLFTGILLLSFFLYALFSLMRTQGDLARSSRIVTGHYAEMLDKDVRRMADSVDDMFANNEFYRRLVWYNLDDFDWVGNTWHIGSALREKSVSLDFMGGHFYYDLKRDSMRSFFSQDLPDSRMSDHLKAWLKEHSDRMQYTDYFVYRDEVWYVHCKGLRGRILGYMIDLSRYTSPEDFDYICYLDRESNIVCRSGSNVPDADQLLSKRPDSTQFTSRGRLLIAADVPSAGLRMVTITNAGGIRPFFRSAYFLIPVLVIPLLTFFALAFLYRYHNRALLLPVEHLLSRVRDLKREDIQDETAAASAKTRGSISEYHEINQRIDELLREISELTEARHREEMNAKNALLQYYQLQIDPHFYLNCLNSISSLLGNGTPEMANDMIMSLSSHFRYVFQSSQSLVLLKEELKELKNYCSIYAIKGGLPILFSDEVPEELKDLRIPILTLQTFAENSVKHVARNGKVLSVRVQAFLIDHEKNLLMRVTDNGPGYPEALLSVLNQPLQEFRFNSEHVGIQNLKYRCRLLYGGREHFLFYNAPSGGAVTEIIVPVDREEETLEDKE